MINPPHPTDSYHIQSLYLPHREKKDKERKKGGSIVISLSLLPGVGEEKGLEPTLATVAKNMAFFIPNDGHLSLFLKRYLFEYEILIIL